MEGFSSKIISLAIEQEVSSLQELVRRSILKVSTDSDMTAPLEPIKDFRQRHLALGVALKECEDKSKRVLVMLKMFVETKMSEEMDEEIERKTKLLENLYKSHSPDIEGLTFRPTVSCRKIDSSPTSFILSPSSYRVASYSYLKDIDFTRGESRDMPLRGMIGGKIMDGDRKVIVRSKVEVVRFVFCYISELLVGMGLAMKYVMVEESGRFRLRYDIHQLRRLNDSAPVGIIVVESPHGNEGPSALERTQVMGRAHSYMMLLKTMHGVDHPIAIVATIEEFRVCWLETLPDLASAGELATLDPPPGCATEVQAPITAGAAPDKVPEFIFVSPVISISQHGAKVVNDAVGSALLAMTQCESAANKNPFAEFAKGTAMVVPKIKIHDGNIVWSNFALKLEPLGLELPRMPVSECSDLFLIKCLGYGAHGCAWLAATPNAEFCVLKFPHRIDSGWDEESIEASIMEERELWSKVHEDLGASVQRWLDMVTLVMPYLAQASLISSSNVRATVDAGDEKTLAAVKVELENFASKGLEHKDVKWANIGFYGTGEVLHAVLIDLALVTKHEGRWEGAEEWVESMIQKLIKEHERKAEIEERK